MTTQITNEGAHDRALTRLLAAYVVVVLLLVSVSARLWWQSPLRLIEHEFDYFLGLFSSPDPELSATWVMLGRRLHLFGLVLAGGLYLVLVRRLVRSPSILSTRSIVAWSAGVSLIFALGMPWVSPDVFCYIGTGWADTHYGLSPYVAGVNAVPGFAQDQMFANMFPGFKGGPTAYGPLFQKLAALLAGLSGGNEKLALALFKIASLALHAGCSALVWRLAPANFKRVALFSYAANPLIGFSILTCAHNDDWMNLFVLLALLAVSRRHWVLSGAALGAAFGTKYFPLVFVPVFGLAALVQQRERGGTAHNVLDSAKLLASFMAVVVLVYLPYPGALKAFSNVAAVGITVYRNSVYHFIAASPRYVLPALSKSQPFGAAYDNAVGATLRGAFIALYGVLLVALIGRLRKDMVVGIAEGCLAATVLYFLLVNTGVQEWYLTWMLGLALLLPYDRAHALAWGLSASFLPLVIYTVNNPAPIWFIANVALYCLMLVLGMRYLVSLARTMAPARE